MKERAGIKQLILPGLMFQSLIISGGYGTGAELSAFFFPYGPRGGLLSMVVTFLVWAAVCVVTFEFVRVHNTYDYKSMFKALLGRGWILFEICYYLSTLCVMAVIAATAGLSLQSVAGCDVWVGAAIVCLCITLLVCKGTAAVERFLSLWSYALYAVYIIFLVICFTRFGDNISRSFSLSQAASPALIVGGGKYAFYNLGMIPAVLLSTRHLKTKRDTTVSGILAALIAVLPAVFLFVSMCGMYPGIINETAPVIAIFNSLDMPLLQIAFQVVLFGTLIETGAGVIKGLSDRFESEYTVRKKQPPFYIRPALCCICLCAGLIASTLGLDTLIEKGYGNVTWLYLAIYVLPMLTAGIVKIRNMANRGMKTKKFGNKTVK